MAEASSKTFWRKGALFMIMVCSNHVKEALKIIVIPHISVIPEEENGRPCCHLCSSTAKYKLFNYSQQRNKTKEAI
jgi:hypothetical protein